jgi:hypothetical protein
MCELSLEALMSNETKNEYAIAGWLAIATAVLILPSFVLGIATEVAKHKAPELMITLLVPYFLITILYTIFSIYVILRFRRYLNNRHGFHAIDGLITAIIVGVITMTLYAMPMKVLGLMDVLDSPLLAILAVIPIAVIGIPMGIIGIIIGVRLLALPSQSTSYFKVYAWLSIAAGICFVTFFLGPLGGLIDGAANIVLAMLFLKPETDEIQPDFV